MFSHIPLFYSRVEGGAKEREGDGVVVGSGMRERDGGGE